MMIFYLILYKNFSPQQVKSKHVDILIQELEI